MLRPPVVAIVTLVLLLGAAVAAAALDERAPSGAEAEAHTDSHAHEARGSGRGGHGAGAHEWHGGTGAVPTLQDALLYLERRASIVIANDSQFNPSNGVRSGSGTYDDPFVISGWFVDTILIADTSKAFEVKGNYVNTILVLDWTGQGGYVHHNHLQNLRTNRNVDRTGDPSATVIENNTILLVEELRHFDGELRFNAIGSETQLPLLTPQVALNIAGLNGAGIHDNTIHGGVDMKIHGHHHSDAPGAHSHNHGEADDVQMEDHYEDHQVRYVDFRFYRNRIVDDGFGLRYNDLNHAGDDRQATSEQEPDLELPHIHHTTVTIEDNVIEGATMRVVVLNSADERHVAGQTATLLVHGNRILKPSSGDGLVVQDVRDALVDLRDNVVEGGGLSTGGAAIHLQRFANSTVLVDGNTLGAYEIGVRAREFDANTTWTVGANKGDFKQPVYWDDSVANAPTGAASGEHQGHDHDEPSSAPAAPTRRDGGLLAALGRT